MQLSSLFSVKAPVLSVGSTTATSISLSWTSAGSVVEYEVMWQRDTSGECDDEDEGSTTITYGSTSYNVTGLEEDSNYTVSVMAMNSIGNANSNTVTGMTVEAGKKIDTKQHYVYNNPIQPLLLLQHLWEHRQAHFPASLSSGAQ